MREDSFAGIPTFQDVPIDRDPGRESASARMAAAIGRGKISGSRRAGMAYKKGIMMEEQRGLREVARPVGPDAKPPRPSPLSWLSSGGGSETDLTHGQIVIVVARWILVASGLVLALWNPESIGPLRLQVLVLLLVAVGNFFLHAQLLRRRIALDGIAYAASAADLAVITLLVASQDGFASNLFVFYFPAVLALSVAFEYRLTALYTAATIAGYGLICLASFGLDIRSEDVQTLVVRGLMLTAVAVCGALYQRIERNRRTGEQSPDYLVSTTGSAGRSAA
jgi:hypothetical protein